MPGRPTVGPAWRKEAAMQPRRFAEGFAFPEGPAFDTEGNLYLVSMGNGDILRVTPDGGVSLLANTGGAPNGLAFGPDGLLYVAEARHRAILRVDRAGTIAILLMEAEGEPFRAPNDLCFDPRGGFYFTDPGSSSAHTPVGRVFYCPPGGPARQVAGGLCFPNGLALTADAKALYVVNELAQTMVRFDVQDDGTLGPKQDFAPIRRGGIGGDGMALDAEGNLYVANYGLGAVDVISPAGDLLDCLPAGGARPTNVAFGGPDMRDLYITECETGAVYVLRAEVAGLRLFWPEDA